MVNLDDPQLFKQYDPAGMLDRLHEMPEQCQRAWKLAMDFDLPRDYRDIDKVVILGMGGSAIGGDLVGSLAVAEAKVPVLVHRSYDLPAFIDARTLIIASSYSGMTEETLSVFKRALKTDSRKLVITTGGKIKSLAEAGNVPVFSFNYKAQPRAALAFSLLPILAFLQKLGFLSEKSADVTEVVRGLQAQSRRINEDMPSLRNPAKQLAERLFGKLPVIYGAGITAEVAHRWKTQINENGKSWAFYEALPELNHNAVVGYQFPADLAGETFIVLLGSSLLSERIQLRYRITCQLLEQAQVGYQMVDGEGNSPLSQVMSLVLFGDYVSYYLALLYKIDPTPVEAIDFLKERLARGQENGSITA